MLHTAPSRFSPYLEFALTVLVLGWIGALALDRIAQLQASAASAKAATKAAQTRSLVSLREASATLSPCLKAPSGASDSVVKPVCP